MGLTAVKNDRNELTVDRVRELLEYNPETGVMKWRAQRGNRKAGDVAGDSNGNGYLRVAVDGRRCLVHRLVWFYMTGRWPADQIDHKNWNGEDNRWCNLREATRSENQTYRRYPKGFYFQKSAGKYHAKIQKNGKRLFLGMFDTAEAAQAAYTAAARELFGEFAGTK